MNIGNNENKEICVLCGSAKSYKFSKLRNDNGSWDGKSYKCEMCRGLLRNYGTVDKEKIKQIQLKYRESKHKLFGIERKCCECGRRETYYRESGHKDWYWKYDINENWTGEYICNKCYSTEYQKRFNSQKNLMKDVTKSRIGELDKYNGLGLGLIGEAVIAKIRGLDIVSIKTDKFNAKFDLSKDPEYGIIQVKIRNIQESLGIQIYELWTLHVSNYDFDYLFILCISFDMKNIERLYIIPKNEIGTMSISIYKNDSKWEKFRVDEKLYSDIYKNLISFLGDKNNFGIEDIKQWMEL